MMLLSHKSRCRAAGSCSAAAAGGATPGISLKRYVDSAAAPAVVTERRAADVAVVGGSTAAVLAAYSLARSGRKVVLLESFGLSAATPTPRPLQPLKLPDPDPVLTHLAAESASYWGGLQLLSGAQLLAEQQSLDVVLDPAADHAGAAAFDKLQEACAAVGVPCSLLTAAEANSSFKGLQLPPHRASALLQPYGGVLVATQAAAAARQLASNAGVMIRDGLSLSGWRDKGSCFELRAVSALAPEALTCLYEAEVLLLAPGAWAPHCLGLFGLDVQGLQVRAVVSCRLPVSNPEQLRQLPLLHTWGAAAAADAPQQPEGWTLLPPAASAAVGDSRVLLQQQAAWGVPVASPFEWQQQLGQQQQPRQQQQQGLGLGEETDIQQGTASWADLQARQLHASCTQLLRGLAPATHPACSCSTSLLNTLPDGRPLIGSHPGFDAGRVVVCSGVVGSQPYGPGGSSSSFQLSPMLAKLATEVITTGGSSSSSGGDNAVLSGVSLQRDGVGASSTLQQLDAWEGLQRLQQPPTASAEQQEELQDLARDAEQDLIGRRQ